MACSTGTMQRLECHVKNYAWGKDGTGSEVARLFAAGHPNHQIGTTTPYAELWMGTHPDGPARVRESSENLSRLIARGVENNNAKEVHLPFIMKIMSIKHTLSLQVHPTVEQAKRLHKKDPKNYPDRHHKPELAYALTRFELLCGFRPATEIVQNMEAFPELQVIMGEKESRAFITHVEKGVSQESPILKKALRDCFAKMLNAQLETPELVEKLLATFYKRIDEGVRGALIEDTVPVLHSMRQHFPGDVGCFSPLYVNHMILQPGECCFYAAEELHAYLSGECVECVGCSNNTIRAALTPKFIDREALIDVLNYRMTTPDFYLVPPERLADYPAVTEYAPDCKDFTLHEIDITSAGASSSVPLPTALPPLECASIIVIVEGEADFEAATTGFKAPAKQYARRGDIYYIPARQAVSISRVFSPRLLAYRTFSYELGPDHSARTLVQPVHAPHFCSDNILPIRTKTIRKPELEKFNERPKFGLENADLFDVEADMDGLC
uniref:mannose-6-phosphate isomerase n=1 Tax=Panagrellus redivivus TaxID=6233 RepID=A0A7E4VTW0_PANRE